MIWFGFFWFGFLVVGGVGGLKRVMLVGGVDVGVDVESDGFGFRWFKRLRAWGREKDGGSVVLCCGRSSLSYWTTAKNGVCVKSSLRSDLRGRGLLESHEGCVLDQCRSLHSQILNIPPSHQCKPRYAASEWKVRVAHTVSGRKKKLNDSATVQVLCLSVSILHGSLQN